MNRLSIKKQWQLYHLPGWKKPRHLLTHYLAFIWLKLNPQVTIIAVTGSFGKTSTTRIITQLLKTQAPAIQTDTNLDTLFNLPQTILRIRKRHRWVVLEVGVDHRQEMDFHRQLFKPDLVVFTGITPVHADKKLLGSIKGIVKEKGKIVKALKKTGLLIYNQDDSRVKALAKGTRAVGYSLDQNKKADYYLKASHLTSRGTRYVIVSRKTGKSLSLKTHLFGRHFAQSFMAAMAVADDQGVDFRKLKTIVKKLKPLKGRMSMEKFVNGSTLLNDRLRSNPASAEAGLKTVDELKKFYKRTIVVMGEMGELGKQSVKSHQKIGKIVEEVKPDFFLGVGPLTKHIAGQINNRKTNISLHQNPLEAAEFIKQNVGLKKGDLVYVKASLLRHLERLEIALRGGQVNCQRASCSVYQPCQKCRYLRQNS